MTPVKRRCMTKKSHQGHARIVLTCPKTQKVNLSIAVCFEAFRDKILNFFPVHRCRLQRAAKKTGQGISRYAAYIPFKSERPEMQSHLILTRGEKERTIKRCCVRSCCSASMRTRGQLLPRQLTNSSSTACISSIFATTALLEHPLKAQ